MIKKIFTTSYLKVTLKTNHPQIVDLLNRVMVFGVKPDKDAMSISFKITYDSQQGCAERDYSYRHVKQGEGIHRTFLQHGFLAAVSVDQKRKNVTGVVSDLKKRHHPRLIQALFIDPMIQLLGLRGYQFIHSALVEKDGKCLLVSGPSGSGKSTLSLLLATQGGNLLTDDKCLFKFGKDGKSSFLIMRQNIGVQRHLWDKIFSLRKRHSQLDYDGSRRRIPANSFLKENADQFKLQPKVILFPSFKESKKIQLKKLNAQESFRRLMLDKSNTYNASRHKTSLSEALFALHQLARRTDAYEVIYNDRDIVKVGQLIKPLLE